MVFWYTFAFDFGPHFQSIYLKLAGLLFQTNAATIFIYTGHDVRRGGEASTRKDHFRKSKGFVGSITSRCSGKCVLAIVILPYSDKSLCDHKFNIFCIFVAFSQFLKQQSGHVAILSHKVWSSCFCIFLGFC